MRAAGSRDDDGTRANGDSCDSCDNCGTALAGPYCSHCGQRDRHPTRVPLTRLAGEWLGDLFTFDSRVLRTLWPLLRRPGFLTQEYLAGRRVRYVSPLRLFVFLSLIMFLVMGLTGPRFSWHVTDGSGEKLAAWDAVEGAPSREEIAEPEPSPSAEGPAAIDAVPAPPPENAEAGSPSRFDVDDINRRLLDSMSQTMILLVPVMAFLVWLLHRRRSPYYASHLVFALHVHSFWFLVMTVAGFIDLLPLPVPLGKLLIVLTWLPYLHVAQRRVYGGGRWVTLGRTALVALGQTIAFFVIVWFLLMRTAFGG